MSFRSYALLAFAGLQVIASANFLIMTLTDLQQPPSPPTYCSSTSCFESVAIGIAGLGMIILGLRGMGIELVRNGYLPGRRPKPIPKIGSEPEDLRILAVAKELLSQARIRRIGSIETLAWSDNQPWFWCGLGRESLRKPTRRLVLSADLRGKLEIEDWRLLLAYNFLQLRPNLPTMIRGIVWMLLVPSALGLPAAILSFTFGRVAAVLYSTIVGPTVVVLSLIWISLSAKRLFLSVDEHIARSLGIESLVSIFRKVDELKLPDVENGKRREGWITRIWPLPNMKERLSYLQNLTAADRR